MVMRRPYTVINVAASADGKIDTFERRGAPVSSDADRQRVDALRAAADGVMVGGRTLLDEDPRLTIKSDALRAQRQARGLPEHPAKIGVVSIPTLKPGCRFLTAGPARIILFTASAKAESAALTAWQPHVEIYPLSGGGGAPGSTSLDVPHAVPPPGGTRHAGVDLRAAMSKLVELGIASVLVEGGGSLNFELLRLGLVDEVLVYVAPLIFGGATSPTLADGGGVSRQLAIKLMRTQIDAQADGGVLLRYKVEPT